MSNRSLRGPYKRYLTDDNAEIPESTLRRRRLEAEVVCAQVQRDDSDEEVLYEGVSPDNSSTLNGRENREADWDSVNNSSSFSSATNTNENVESDQRCTDDTFTDQSSDILSDVNSDHSSHNSIESGNYEVVGGINNERQIHDEEIDSNNETTNDESSNSGHNSSDEDDGSVVQNENQHQRMNGPCEDNERTPLYNGCDLSKEESELLILSFLIRYNLPDIALNELLELINCHLPAGAHWHLSKFKLLKNFQSEDVKAYYYYPQCENSIINFGGFKRKQCEECGYICDVTELKEAQNYFLHLPLTKQIAELMNNERVYQSLRKECDESDVIKGRAYRKLVEENVISENDITLQWNTDGVKIFLSSKVSLWPIQVAINELPYHLRRQYMMLTGLWCGSHKPIMKLFLKPFIDELTELHVVGLLCTTPEKAEPVTVKVHTLLAPVDSVARPMLQNMKQFNGEYGCSFCLNKGERVPIGRGYTRIYCGTDITKRTIHQHRVDCEEADRTNTVIKGVKGSSLLLMLPIFNVLLSCVPDYMHSVLLGVVKTFTDMWFDSKWSDKPWALGRDCNTVDKKLLSVRPPCDITRTPRSILERHKWKASEWKNFLLYYSLTALKESMPQKYLNHWFLLVFAMHSLLRDTVTRDDIIQAKRALEKFVAKIEPLYGREFLKFNVHLLLHIADSVKHFGSLWAQSTFPFEHYNGVLAKMFKNSQWVPEQIFKIYLRYKKVEQLCDVAFSRDDCDIRGKLLYEKLLVDKNKTMNTIEYGPALKLLGVGIPIPISVTQQVLIENLLSEPVILDEVVSYQRFVYKKVLYHTDSYGRLKKRENSTVSTRDFKYGTIRNILIVRTLTSDQSKCVILVNELFSTGEELVKDTNLNISSNSFCTCLRQTTRQICMLPESISQKCVQVHYDPETLYVIPLVNSIEKD